MALYINYNAIYIMTSVSNNRILNIYKSRKTILDLLYMQDYEVAEYKTFTINEIDAMYSNSQLDMLVHNPTTQTKAYIHYYISDTQTKQLRPNNLEKIIQDLFYIDTVLDKKDTLIIIIDEEPNDTLISKLNYTYNHSGIFVVVHNIKRLQFNLLEHKLIPEVSILTEPEVEELKKTYNIRELSQLPEISRYDPMALAMCMRPKQVCKLVRNSPTAMYYVYYRVCV